MRNSGQTRPQAPVGYRASMRVVPESIAAKIRAVAADVLVEDQDPSIDTVAAASGVPRATLYYHFRGKAELLDYMVTELLADASTEVAAANSRQGDAAERLTAALNAIVDVVVANPGLIGPMLIVLSDPGHYTEAAVSGGPHLGTPIRDILVQGNEEGSFDVRDPDTAMITILGATIVTASAFIKDAPSDYAASIRENLLWQITDGVRSRT